MFAIVSKKERWGATPFGNFLKLISLLLVIFLYAKCIHPFLSYHHPVESKIMVVEGFIPDHSLLQAYDIFQNDNYKFMIITGKKREKGAQLDSFGNDGKYSAAILRKMGMRDEQMQVVTMDFDIKKDRTFATAEAVNDWIKNNRKDIQSVNIVSIGCHSRRSHLLFKKAFDSNIELGIIATNNPSYDPEKWWKSSRGFREVVQESIAWIYARFFFFPDAKQ
jgi:hypothetical protein